MQKLLWLFYFFPLFCFAEAIEVNEGLTEKGILPFSEIIELEKGSDLESAKTATGWKKVQSWPNFKRDKSIWLRFLLLNQRESNELYLNVWGIEKASVYLEGTSKAEINGKHVPYHQRNLPHDPDYILIRVKPGKPQWIYVKVECGDAPLFYSSMEYWNRLALSINSPDKRSVVQAEKYGKQENGILLHHLTLGGVLLFMLFGYGLYLELGDKHYLHFTRYLLFTVIYGFFSSANGDFIKQFFDYIPLLKQYHSIPIFWLGFLMWYSFFVELTSFNIAHPKLHGFFYNATLGFCLLLGLATIYLLLTNDRGLYVYLDRISNGLLLLMVLILTWVIFTKLKSDWASYIQLALTALFLFGLGSYFKYDIFPVGEMPYGINRFLTIQTGVFLDTCIFTFAIAKKIKKDQQAKIETQRKYFETEKQAIQAKLNPHFLFNSLNAARSLILEKNIDLASKYLLAFSKFLRGSLNSTDAGFHSLEEELQLAEQYLQIESQRMSGRLKYAIHALNENADQIAFPPLLLQPLLENSIWHGTGSKIIEIYLKVNEEITLTIRDNSGGINKKTIEELIQSKNKHFGLRLFQNKIDLFNAKNERKIVWNTQPNQIGGTDFILTLV